MQQFDKNDPDGSYHAIKGLPNYPKGCFEELLLIGKLTETAEIRDAVADCIAQQASKDIQQVWKHRKKLKLDFSEAAWLKVLLQYATISETLDVGRQLQLLGINTLFLNDEFDQPLPDEIGRFTSVTKITLRSKHVAKLPAGLGKLQQLEELDLDRGFTELPPALGQLQGLKKLTLSLSQFQEFPMVLCDLQQLEVLYISGPSYVSEEDALKPILRIPSELNRLQNLQKLELAYFYMESLPDALFDLPQLKCLSMARMENLKTLPAGVAQLRALEELSIHTSPQFETLPAALDQLPALAKFEIGSLPMLRSISGNLRYGPAIMKFTIGNNCTPQITPTTYTHCNQRQMWLNNDILIKDFFANILLFQHLEDLHLEIFDPGLHISEAIGTLPVLKKLNIRAPRLQALPIGLGNLSRLESLVIQAQDLRDFPSLSGCERLVQVDLDCPSLDLDMGKLPDKLHEAKLKCATLTQTSGSSVDITSRYLRTKKIDLSHPEVMRIGRLHIEDAVIPENLVSVVGVHSLTIRSKELKVPVAIGEMESLRHLCLYTQFSFKTEDCFLSTFPQSMAKFDQLETLRLIGSTVVNLDFLRNMHSLRSLQIQCFPNITVLPDSLASLPKLENRSLGILPLLEDISLIQQLSQLKKLEINWVEKFNEKNFENITHLKELQYLCIDRWSGMKSIPESIQNLVGLVTLKLKSLEIHSIPEVLSHLPLLEELGIQDLTFVNTLPSSLAKLPLRRLHLGHTTLAELPEAFLQLKLTDLRMWHSKFAGHNTKADVYQKLISQDTQVHYKDSGGTHQLFDEVPITY